MKEYVIGIMLLVLIDCHGDVNQIDINLNQVTKTNVNAGAAGAVLCWLTDGDERVRPPTTTAEAIEELGCGALRFPYGALADRYLWHSGDYSTATNGLVPKMVYVPSYMLSWPGINPDGTFYQDMDFDEYMDLCQTQGRKSMVCVNALSHKTNPGQITYEELKTNAVEWVRYAMLKGYQVDCWQIGNEVDHHDDVQTKAEYLALYRDFAQAMKEVDPTIKVGPGILSNSNWYQPLVADSPELTDFVSVHQYMWTWTSSIANYEDWNATSDSYIPHINTAINVIDANATKPTEIHVTETNVTGNDSAGTVNNLFKSLWLAEVLLNQIKAKYVAYSYYWGLHSPWKGTNDESAFEGDDLSVALRMDNNGFKPSAQVISLLNRFVLDTFVGADKTVNQIRTYATRSALGDKTNIILINRNDVAEEVELSFNPADSVFRGTCYTYTGTDPYDQFPVFSTSGAVAIDGGTCHKTLPRLSITVLELGIPQNRYWRGGDPPSGSSTLGWGDKDNWYLDVAGTIGAAAVPGASESVVLHTTTASGGANDRRDTIKLNADREATSIEVLPGAGFDADFDVDESDLFVIKRGSTTPRTLTLHGTRPIYFRSDGTEVGRTLRFDALGSTGANGDADLVFAGPGDATITIEGTTDVIEISYDIIDGISSNAARLIKDGAGLLVLNTPRTNTYSGDWQIDQGELRIGDGTVRGNIGSGNVQVNGGTLALNRSNGVSVSNPMDLHDGSMILARLGGNTISGEVMMNATKGMTVTLEAAFGTTLDLLPGNAIELDDTTLLLLGDGEGAIGKSLALDGKNATIIKDGSGIWSLSNPDNNWSAGGVMIGNGVLKLGGDEVIPHGTGKGAVTIESAGTLDLAGHTERINDLLGNGTVDNTSGESAVLKLGAASAAGTFDGMIQNSGSPLTLHKVNGGINTLGGSNTFSGGVAIFNGVLKLGNKYALGAANLLTMKNDSTGTLQLDRYFPTFAGLVSDGTVGDSVIENSHAANTAILNVDVASGQRHVYRDTLRDGGAAPLRLVKKGPGTQVLDTAANTELSCSGNTTIQDGTLVMNAIFTGGGSFTVWSAGTLAGNGAINTTVTVNGTVAPGDELGTLTVNGDLDLNGTYRCQIAGDSVDQLAVGGNLDISSAILKVEEVSSPGKPVYIIATYGSLTGDSFTSVVNLPTGYEVDTAYNGNQIALVKRPVMDISQEAGQGAIINWEGHSNSTYSLLFKSNLFDSIWMPIAAYTNLPGLPDISVTNPVPGKSRGFFLMQMD